MATQSIPAHPTFGGRKALFGALILGAIAAGLIVAFLSTRDSGGSVSADVDTLEVVVATREIAVGTRLDETMVRLKAIPKSAVISDPFLTLKPVIGTQTRYPLQANEQLAVGRLLAGVEAKTLSVQIPKGLRGFTVAVSVNNSPAGLLAPGDFVDVLVSAELMRLGSSTGTLSGTLSGDDNPKAALTLLQNVQVLSVQRNYVSNGVVYDSSTRGEAVDKDDDVGYVTLAITPEQAQLLWLATQEGKITLTLRAFGDDTVQTLPPVAEPIRINTGTN